MNTNEYWMRAALAEAKQALDEGEVPIGAVVVANEQIIGRGHNRTEALADVTAHAEMQAITAAALNMGAKYLNGCTLYVTIEPCTMCAGAIAWSQIQRLVYGAPDPKRGYQQYAPKALHPRCQTTTGVLSEECAALVREFFKQKRRGAACKAAAN